MPYIHFTEEQKNRAASVDLEEFLRMRGEKLTRSGREKRMTSDHSVTGGRTAQTIRASADQWGLPPCICLSAQAAAY